MKSHRWVGGIYVFGPDEEADINDFIDFFETGASLEDIVEKLRIQIYPILKRIAEEIKRDDDTLPPLMGHKRP
jgi:hypothetical protein